MKVKVKFYSVYRDKLGEEKEYELREGATVSDLLEILKEELGELYELAKPVVLVNKRYADEREPLSEEYRIDVIPPAAGGRRRAIVTFDKDIDVNEVIKDLSNPESGAIVLFVGFVKSKGGLVKELVYEAHEDLEKFIEEKIDEVVRERNLIDALVVQFLGPRKVGEKTLIVATSATSREEAFQGARELLEKMKHEVPIWKLERRVDGEYWLVGDKELKRL
ncbi:hypothetical protein EYM_03190 [Ignicoccus islandicus DSM 13165]|uniref:Molybdenum cofactor biosynthesis protein MoaD n=1 Tax=Ignicoccus islandicus DSM 13165 TaxID=940295 RepID=A0A0U3F9R4_9CREN|nr:molybdenum cofactor biosynthesis protein MoaE [Ignicoccus islandicus]ALU12393.1 hypothetical protein EYM_03190 [Ignicoccus islandicus DSM 13165]